MPKYPGIRVRIQELFSRSAGGDDPGLEAARRADADEIGRRADQRRRDRAPEEPMPDQAPDEAPDGSGTR